MTQMTPPPRNDTERRILRVLDYIHDNPTGDLSLDALADVAAMSRFHWHRVFRAVTGETLAQSVRRMRLNRASPRSATQIRQAFPACSPNTTAFPRPSFEIYLNSPTDTAPDKLVTELHLPLA